MKQKTIKFSDNTYKLNISHNKIKEYNHIVLHKIVENTPIDTKFEIFLTDDEFKEFCSFFCFANQKEN
jgi:hypothetical protein